MGPLLLRALDDFARSSLQGSRNTFFDWLLISTALVLFGVVFEETDVLLTFKWVRRCLPIKILLPAYRLDSWAKAISIIGWAVLLIGVIGEGAFEGLVSEADGWLQEFNNILLSSQQAEIKELGDITAQARKDATEASKASGTAKFASANAIAEAERAKTASSNAMQLARSFEKDIKDAKRDASEAKALLSDARQLAVDARQEADNAAAELRRIKTPRSLTNVDDLVDTLEEYKGTEYMFTGCFGDSESINILESIDDALWMAGWKRLLPPSPGFAAIPIHENKPSAFTVAIGLTTGIEIRFTSVLPTAVLNITPPYSRPPQVRIATALRNALKSHIVPLDDRNVPPQMQEYFGDQQSTVIRINVGRKPY